MRLDIIEFSSVVFFFVMNVESFLSLLWSKVYVLLCYVRSCLACLL